MENGSHDLKSSGQGTGSGVHWVCGTGETPDRHPIEERLRQDCGEREGEAEERLTQAST